MNKIFRKSYYKLIQGFTIIELTIYIALMSVLILVISRIFISSLDVQINSEAVSRVDQDGKYLLSRLQHDISQADELLIPETPGSTSASLVLRTNGINTLYELNGNTFEITDETDSQRLNSNGTNVRDLSFQRIGNSFGNDTIQIRFTLQSTIDDGGGPETKNFQTTIGIR